MDTAINGHCENLEGVSQAALEEASLPGVLQGCGLSPFPAAEVGMALKASTFIFEEGAQSLPPALPGTKMVIN